MKKGINMDMNMKIRFEFDFALMVKVNGKIENGFRLRFRDT